MKQAKPITVTTRRAPARRRRSRTAPPRRAPAPKFGGVRTGGRSARVVDRVLTATVELLGQSGYGALRFDEVAARSGVNKTTIYRRWPTKSQLVAAAIQHHKPIVPPRDTGDLERDLTEMFVEALSKFDVVVMRGLMRMVQAEHHDPELDAILVETRRLITSTRRIRLDAAVARGELPRRTDITLMMDMLASAVHVHLLRSAERPSPLVISDIVRVVVAGARVRWADVRHAC